MGCCLGVLFFFVGLFSMGGGGVAYYAAVPPETTNILILGADARPGAPGAELARTDSIMVLSVNPRGQAVSLFSVPRDVFIQSPQYGWLRANTVVRNAELSQPGSGPGAMIAAMENTFRIEVDHYVRVNFEAFVDVVDAVGGVTVDVPQRIVDNSYPTADYGTMRIEFAPGEQTLDGERALIYARTRHGDDDYRRAERQQQILSALFGELLSPAGVTRWPAVGIAVQENLETSMNGADMLSIAPGILLYGNRPSQIEQFVVERAYLRAGSAGPVPNMSALDPWLDDHLR